LPHCERIEQRPVLKHHGDLFPDALQLFLRVVRDVLKSYDYPPRIGLQKSHNVVQRNRLATPLRPRMQTVSPGSTSKLTSSSTQFEPKVLNTCLNSMYGLRSWPAALCSAEPAWDGRWFWPSAGALLKMEFMVCGPGADVLAATLREY